MAQQVINVGTTANDGTGDTLRVSQQKANANFTELYEGKLESVVAGTNVSINNTDPLNPVINVTGGGGGSQTIDQVLEVGSEATDKVLEFFDTGTGRATTISGLGGSASGSGSEFTYDFEKAQVGDGTIFTRLIKQGLRYLKGSFGVNMEFAEPTGTTGKIIFPNVANATKTVAMTDNIPDVDATPTNGSANPVSSNGVFDALELKQRNLFDFQTKEGFYLFEDFLGNGVPTTSVMWSGESSGAGSSIVTVNNYPNRTNQQGVLRFATGTTSTGLAQKRLGDNNNTSHYLGNGIYTLQFFVNIETLSTSLERFYSIFGATTNAAFGNTNGIFFIYDEGVGTYGTASPNWKCITRNSTITSTITTIPVVASQWYVLKIVVNANASSVQFYIDNVLIATHTTNIVTLITPRVAHVKTVGTTSRNAYVDYSLVQQIYTTPRTI